MSDYMVRATAAEGQIRIFAVTAKDLVESAKNHHNTSPVMTGRRRNKRAVLGV